jgi:hypothetical protein
LFAVGSTRQGIQPTSAALELAGRDEAPKDLPRELILVEVSRPQECPPAGQGDDAVRKTPGLACVSFCRHILIFTDVS